MKNEDKKIHQKLELENDLKAKKINFLKTQIADKANYDAFKRLTEK